VHDTWAARDLPVLDATIALLEQSFMVTVTDIAARCELSPAAVAAALEALDPVYVDFRKTTTGGDPRFWYVFKVTPEARRAVGQWPTAESLASRLAEELAAQAQREVDAERHGLLVYAARLVGDTLRDATVRAARRVLAPAFGGVPVPELGTPVPEPVPDPEDDYASLVDLPALPELLRSRSTGGEAAAEPESSEPDDFAPDEPGELYELGELYEHGEPDEDEPGEPDEDEAARQSEPVARQLPIEPEAQQLPPLPDPDEPGEPDEFAEPAVVEPTEPEAQELAPFRWLSGTNAAVNAPRAANLHPPEADEITLQ
jgi:hypothetical protein